MTQSPAPAGPPGLDLSVLDTVVGGDPARFRKYALLFMRSVEDVLAQVDVALAQGDLPALAEMGHRAKSSSRNVGAVALADQCMALEQAAKALDAAKALELGRRLRPLYQGIREAIDQRLAQSGGAG